MLQSQFNFIYTSSVRAKVLYWNPEPDTQTSSTSTEKVTWRAQMQLLSVSFDLAFVSHW